MLYEFQTIWDGNLCRMDVVKYRIELLRDHVQPVYSTHYRAGTKTREFKKVKIDTMIEQEVLEPAQTEWAAPIVFATKKGEK